MKDSKEFWNKQASKFSVDESKELDMCFEAAYSYFEQNMKILDFGCGTGISTRKASKKVSNVLGIDYSNEMIELARKATPNDEKIEYKVATIHDKSLNSESYDMVLAFNVLHLVDDPQVALKRIHTLLKPGGLLISSTPCLGEKTDLLDSHLKYLS